jgi:hypothetical protein
MTEPKLIVMSALGEKIEAAIHHAAKLGANYAFDLIEGRGLHVERLEIQSELAALERSVQCAQRADTERCNKTVNGARHVCRFPAGHEGNCHPHINAG